MPVYINDATTAVKRFYLGNARASSNSISVLTSLELSFTMNTTGYLTAPQLKVGYTSLSIQNGKVTPTTESTQTITYNVNFSYDLTSFWTTILVLFIIINVLVLIQAIIRTYIGFLNR